MEGFLTDIGQVGEEVIPNSISDLDSVLDLRSLGRVARLLYDDVMLKPKTHSDSPGA